MVIPVEFSYDIEDVGDAKLRTRVTNRDIVQCGQLAYPKFNPTRVGNTLGYAAQSLSSNSIWLK